MLFEFCIFELPYCLVALAGQPEPTDGWQFFFQSDSYKSEIMQEKNTTVYIVKFSDDTETFYKIGVTDRFTSRLSPIKRLYSNWEIILEKKFDVRTALELESELINANKSYCYLPNKNFGGYLECFSKINKSKCDEIFSSR